MTKQYNLPNLVPELHRKIFNLLPPWNVMMVHKTCRTFRDYMYYNQLIPLVLYDNIFSLEYAITYIIKKKLKTLYYTMNKNLIREYFYCLVEQIAVLNGDYTRWDCWYYNIAPEFENSKYIESHLYTNFFNITHQEYTKYYKNNRFIKGLL